MPKSAGGLCKNLNKEHSLKVNIYFTKWILKFDYTVLKNN